MFAYSDSPDEAELHEEDEEILQAMSGSAEPCDHRLEGLATDLCNKAYVR